MPASGTLVICGAVVIYGEKMSVTEYKMMEYSINVRCMFVGNRWDDAASKAVADGPVDKIKW